MHATDQYATSSPIAGPSSTRTSGGGPTAEAGAPLEVALLDALGHDLRGSLTAILGSAGTLAEFRHALSEAQQADLLSAITESALELNRYLSGLLDARRLEAAAASAVVEPTDVRELILRVANLIGQRCGGDRLTVNIPRVVSIVPTDGPLLEHALVNLIENAMKYSPDEARVALTLTEQADRLLIEVADRGVGIRPDELQQAFGRFRRLDGTREYAEGYGLGLSIAKRFVEAMGGALEAISPDHGGCGTRMIVSLAKAAHIRTTNPPAAAAS